jgi:hypothetical protein
MRRHWGCLGLVLLTGEGGVSPYVAAFGGTALAGGDSWWPVRGAAKEGPWADGEVCGTPAELREVLMGMEVDRSGLSMMVPPSR